MEKGEQYNFLTAMEFHHRDKKHCFWKFKCICGIEYITRISDVRNGGIKSCGCKRSELLKARATTWAKPKGIASRNALITSYKQGAKKRNLEYNLTTEQFEEITKNNCYYCGSLPLQLSNKHKHFNGTYVYNGIDRIDNDRGYVYNNCISACGICNHAKNNLTKQEFESWIERIAENYKSKNLNEVL